MYGQPGKKLLFTGGEFGQRREWNHDLSLDWHLLRHTAHAGIGRWVGDLNRTYRGAPALHELDFDPAGFDWIDCGDVEQSVPSFIRRGRSTDEIVLVLCNFTPVPRHDYRVGVPWGGFWQEILNSDGREYGGSGQGNMGGVQAAPMPWHGRPYTLTLAVPPLAAVFFKSANP